MKWDWANLTPMKIGTVPSAALIHGTDKKTMAPGKIIRIKECAGGKWTSVMVDGVLPCGTVVASR